MNKRQLTLIIMCLACLHWLGCSNGNDCDVPPERLLNEQTRNAIPHNAGQNIRYEVSDGTEFLVSFRGGYMPAVVELGCRELFILEFSGSNTFHSLSGEFSFSATGPALASIFVNYAVDNVGGNGLRIDLFGEGQITAGRNPTARVLTEITRNGNTYRDVLEQTYPAEFPGQVERIYYNIEAGLIGLELNTGLSMFRS